MVFKQIKGKAQMIPEDAALPLSDRRLANVLSSMQLACYDAESHEFTSEDLITVAQFVARSTGIILTDFQWRQVVAAIGECVPRSEMYGPDAQASIAVWVHDRRTLPDGESAGALHALLTAAWRVADARAGQVLRGSRQGIEPDTAELALAERFYLLAHDRSSGKPLLSPTALAIGLSAAVLGELRLADRARIDPISGIVHPLAPVNLPRSVPDGLSPCSRAALDALRTQPSAAVSTWLGRISSQALDQVRRHLLAIGVLRTASERSLLGTRALVRPTTMSTVDEVLSAVRAPLWGGHYPEGSHAMLAELVRVTGLAARQRREWSELSKVPPGALLAREPRGEQLGLLTTTVAASIAAAHRPTM